MSTRARQRAEDSDKIERPRARGEVGFAPRILVREGDLKLGCVGSYSRCESSNSGGPSGDEQPEQTVWIWRHSTLRERSVERGNVVTGGVISNGSRSRCSRWARVVVVVMAWGGRCEGGNCPVRAQSDLFIFAAAGLRPQYL